MKRSNKVISSLERGGNYSDIPSGKFHLLALGVNTYTNHENLNCPVSDTSKVINLLKKKYGFTVERIPAHSNSDKIFDYLRSYTHESKITDQDFLVIWLAGHGALDDSHHKFSYFIPKNGNPRPHFSNWVNMDTFISFFNRISAQQILLVMDCCHGGGIFKSRELPIQVTSLDHAASLESLKYIGRQGLTSGRKEERVLDEKVNGKSPFATAFLSSLQGFSGPFLTMKVLDEKLNNWAKNNPSVKQNHQIATLKNAGGTPDGSFVFINHLYKTDDQLEAEFQAKVEQRAAVRKRAKLKKEAQARKKEEARARRNEAAKRRYAAKKVAEAKAKAEAEAFAAAEREAREKKNALARQRYAEKKNAEAKKRAAEEAAALALAREKARLKRNADARLKYKAKKLAREKAQAEALEKEQVEARAKAQAEALEKEKAEARAKKTAQVEGEAKKEAEVATETEQLIAVKPTATEKLTKSLAEHKPNIRSKKIIVSTIFSIVFAIGLVTGLLHLNKTWSQNQEWESTKTRGLVSGYLSFVDAFPNNHNIPEAENKIDEYRKAVLQLETTLWRNEFLIGDVDGYVDAATREAVKSFQRLSESKFVSPNLDNIDSKPIFGYSANIDKWVQDVGTLNTEPKNIFSVKPSKPSQNKVFGGPGKDIFSALLVLDNDDVMLAGEVEICHNNISKLEACDKDGWLIKLDSNGQQKWAKNYGGGSSPDQFDAMVTLPDKSILLAGTTSSCYPEQGTSGVCEFNIGTNPRVDKNGLLVKVNQDGQLIWARSYGGSGADSFSALKVSHDETILVGGKTTSCFRKAIDCEKGQTDGWLIKVDLDGKIVSNQSWVRTYGEQNFSEDIDAIALSADGDIYLAGYVRENRNQTKYNYGWLSKTDSEGNLVWQKMLKNGNGNADFDEMVVFPSDRILLAGYYSDTKDPPLLGLVTSIVSGGEFEPLVVSRDGSEESTNINALLPLLDSSDAKEHQVILVGYSDDEQGTARGWIEKTDQHGNRIWSNFYGGVSDNSFNAIGITSDGSIVIAGKTTSCQNATNNNCEDNGTARNKYDGWFLKLRQ